MKDFFIQHPPAFKHGFQLNCQTCINSVYIWGKWSVLIQNIAFNCRFILFTRRSFRFFILDHLLQSFKLKILDLACYGIIEIFIIEFYEFVISWLYMFLNLRCDNYIWTRWVVLRWCVFSYKVVCTLIVNLQCDFV